MRPEYWGETEAQGVWQASRLQARRSVRESCPSPSPPSRRKLVSPSDVCRRVLYPRLARDFGVSEDTVRGWHCLVLLRRGHDVLGEEALSQVKYACLIQVFFAFLLRFHVLPGMAERFFAEALFHYTLALEV